MKEKETAKNEGERERERAARGEKLALEVVK
jgi:hypothetical protein